MLHLYILFNGLVETALAQDNPISRYCQQLHPGCGAGAAFAVQFANRVIDMVSIFIGALAVFGILKGALLITSSGGNDEKVTKGKQLIIGSLVGVFLAIMAKVFVVFVADVVNSGLN